MRTLKLEICVFATFFAGAIAQVCGSDANGGSCGALGPCCSEFQFCGATPAQCGGGCQSQFSGKNACLVSRPGGQMCISGHFAFDNNTWIVPTDAYNGNPQSADFTIDRKGLALGNFKVGPTGQFAVSVSAPGPNDPYGNGARISTTSYLTPGSTATIRMRPSSAGGIVTAFITMADDKDEIDWEITGDPAWVGIGQSNFFSKGKLDYANSQKHWPGSGRGTPRPSGATLVQQFHNYGITWNTDSIVWSIDGEPVRTSTAAQLGDKFPRTNPRVQFAVWDGGYGNDAASAGRREWAGGNVDFTRDVSTRTATVQWIKIQCAGEPEPLEPPVRPEGFYPPYIYAAEVNSVVPGVFGYDATYVGAGKKSLANLQTELMLNPQKVVKNTTSGETISVVNGTLVSTKNPGQRNSASKVGLAGYGFATSVFSALFAMML